MSSEDYDLYFNMPPRIDAINPEGKPSRKNGVKYSGGMELKPGDQLVSIMGTFVKVLRYKKSTGEVVIQPVGEGPEYDKLKFYWKVPKIRRDGGIEGRNDFASWILLNERWIPEYEDSTESGGEAKG